MHAELCEEEAIRAFIDWLPPNRETAISRVEAMQLVQGVLPPGAAPPASIVISAGSPVPFSSQLRTGRRMRRVDQELKDKVDALNWPMNLDPVTKTTKACRYVEAGFLWREKTTHNKADN
jgi:hypothetical protein